MEDAASAGLEKSLVLAEQRYAKDIGKLQQALLRTRKLGVLHIVGLHLQLLPLLEATNTLPTERVFYQWKSNCVPNKSTNIKALVKLLKHLYNKHLVKDFVRFKEQVLRNTLMTGKGYAQGNVPPLALPDDDELDF